MRSIFLFFVIILFSGCNSIPGKGSGSSSSSSSSSSSASVQCPPNVSIGGENYSTQLCNRNQQVEQLCLTQGTPCRQDCNYRRQYQWGTGSAGQMAFEACMRTCDQLKAACLYENYYSEGACNIPQIIASPDCGNENNDSSNQSNETFSHENS